PGVVAGRDKGTGGLHGGVARVDEGHARVDNVVMGITAPALPGPVNTLRQIVAHTQHTPGHVALPTHHHRQEDYPEQTDLQRLTSEHPAATADARTGHGPSGDPIM